MESKVGYKTKDTQGPKPEAGADNQDQPTNGVPFGAGVVTVIIISARGVHDRIFGDIICKGGQ